MRKLTLLLALVIAGTFTSAASAAETARTATIGGGVKNPWTLPYSLAVVAVPEPASVAILGVGAAALLVRRRK